MCHTEIDSDRPGNKVGVRVSPTPAIYRTGIHACTATDAVQCLDVVRLGKYGTAAVIHDDNMVFTAFAGTTVMRSIGGHRLSGSRTGKQSGKYPQSVQIRHNLFHTEGGDIQFRERSPHIGISFIGTDHDITGRGHGKVRARHGCFRIQEKVAQVLAGSVRQVSRVEVSFLRTHFLFKKFAHLLAFDVNGGQDDVARFKMHQLKDTFAQIGFHDINAALH